MQLPTIVVYSWLFLRTVFATSLCGKDGSYAIGAYTYIPNAWGDDGSGFQCIDVDGNGSSFSATWNWATNPSSVHSFPSARLNTSSLHAQLQSLSALLVDAAWVMSLADSSLDDTHSSVVANVAFDMFGDRDAEKAEVSTEAESEVMIWIGSLGSPYPIGFDPKKSNGTYEIDDMLYKLYIGTNQRGRRVYSWLASADITTIHADLFPLLQYLRDKELLDPEMYLGSVAFGSETFFSTENVTFSVSDFQIVVESRQGSGALNSSSSTGGGDNKVGSSSGWVKSSGSPFASSSRRLWLLLVAFIGSLLC